MNYLKSTVAGLWAWWRQPRQRLFKLGLLLFAALLFFATAPRVYGLLRMLTDPRSQAFWLWARGDDAARAELIVTQRDSCPGAPFILPADGFIGLLYGDPRGPYSTRNPHQGIDIFSAEAPGVTPVYAAYDGYITREDHWVSSLIMRVPEDPLQPDRQIWLYYTHLADRDGNSFILDAIPRGTRELFVEKGTLLGYMGDYNGSSLRDIWVHLHFSIIQDNGRGAYTNELEFANSIDPSPYLGMAIHYDCEDNAGGCTADHLCGN